MSASGLGFGLLVKGMAKRVGAIQPGESEDQFMKRAVETTTPIVNSLMSWKAGAQRRVQRFLKQEPPPAANATSKLDEMFVQGETVASSSQSSGGVFDAAGNELVYDAKLDDFIPVLNTAFDAEMWGLVCDADASTASELQDTITGAHQSSADFGGGDDDANEAQ